MRDEFAELLDSAWEENMKMQCLANDCTRRMLTTSEQVPPSTRCQILDDYGQKLSNSGYNPAQIRKIISNGVKAYERKLGEASRKGTGVHRTAEESSGTRRRLKLIGKSSWFKPKPGSSQGDKPDSSESKIPGSMPSSQEDNSARVEGDTDKLKVRSVIFVPHTPGGTLAKRLRELLLRLAPMMGFKIKVAEQAGTHLRNKFSLTRLWEGMKCGRNDCVTCE